MWLELDIHCQLQAAGQRFRLQAALRCRQPRVVLFGARTGDGFAELAALDDDNNGWIDENDAAYAQLSVWTRDSAGVDVLRSLMAADVGAISLARVATPFAVKDANNALQGQVRSSGVYLRESGGVGSVQQVDLTV